jgi:hypothetical protein
MIAEPVVIAGGSWSAMFSAAPSGRTRGQVMVGMAWAAKADSLLGERNDPAAQAGFSEPLARRSPA